MKLFILDEHKVISLNRLQEVTSPVLFNATANATALATPNQFGPLSYKIFGITGTKERISTYAYMNLGAQVFHGHLWKILLSLDRRIAKIATGEIKVILDKNGVIVEKIDGGNWGIPWLLKNITRMNFSRDKLTASRKEKIALLNSAAASGKLAQSTLLMIPAAYREVSVSDYGGLEIGEANEVYSALLSNAALLKTMTPGNAAYLRILYKTQTLILRNYEYTYRTRIWGGGKNSYWKQNVCGRESEAVALGVVSLPNFLKNPNSAFGTNLEVGFNEMGIPLHQLCSIFFPYFLKEINSLIGGAFKRGEWLSVKDTSGKNTLIECKYSGSQFEEEELAHLLEKFAKVPDIRWSPINIKTLTGEIKPLSVATQYLGRPFTICDLFFIAMSSVISDKYVDAVRYPVESVHSHAFLKPKIITTEKTVTMTFGKGLFGDSPFVLENYPVQGTPFRDAILVDVSLWPIQGTDTDGDTYLFNGIWAQDVNSAIDLFMTEMRSILSPSGKLVRSFNKSVVLGIYYMTGDFDIFGLGAKIRRLPITLSPADQKFIHEFGENRDNLALSKITPLFTRQDFKSLPKYLFADKIKHPDSGEITTVGRYLFHQALTLGNEALRANIPFSNKTFGSKDVDAICSNLADLLMADKISVKDVGDCCNRIMGIGFGMVGFAPAYDPKLLMLPPKAAALKEKILKENWETVFKVCDQRKVLVFEKQILDLAKEELSKEPAYLMYFDSKSSGSWEDTYKTVALWIGIVTNLSTGKPVFVKEALLDGTMDVGAAEKADAAVVGAVSRGLKTALGGYKEKIATTVAQTIEISPDAKSDCGTKLGFEVLITKSNTVFFKYCYELTKTGESVLLTPDVLSKKIGETIVVRLPPFCKSKEICSRCIGSLPYTLGYNERVVLTLGRLFSYIKLRSMKSFHNQAVKLGAHNLDTVFVQDSEYQPYASLGTEESSDDPDNLFE